MLINRTQALVYRSLLVLCVFLLLIGFSRHAVANLVVNGDFELGNTGFSTDYGYSPGDIGPEGVYDVVYDPSVVHRFAFSYKDHTSGSGLMMAVNGSASSGKVVWSQTIPVNPSTNYVFSAWVSNWGGRAPLAQLQFKINSSLIGSLTASTTAGVWIEFETTWNSGSDTSATIRIVDTETAQIGNDFSLDDISFDAITDTSCDCPEGDCMNGCISGQVTDKNTGLPLAGKLVRLDRVSSNEPGIKRAYAVTGDSGCYSFTNLNDGTYLINVERCKKGGKSTVVMSGGVAVNDIDFECK